MANARMRLGFAQHAALVLTFSLQSLLQSLVKVSRHFCISGTFSNSHRSSPSPYPTNNVGCEHQKFLSSFNFVEGEEELQENFEKDALFYEGTKKLQNNMNTALLSH